MDEKNFEYNENRDEILNDNEEQNYEVEIVKLIRSKISEEELLERLEDYHENDIAGAFEQLEIGERRKLYKILGPEKISEIFTFIEDVSEYLEEMDLKEVAHVIENMDSDDAVDVLEEMDLSTQQKLKNLMNEDASEDIWLIKSYDEEEIGSKMTTNFILINKNMSVRQAMKALVEQAEKNDNISTLYVADDDDKYCGALELKDLIRARDYMNLQDFMITSFPYVKAHEKIAESIERLKEYEEDSIPVLDDDNKIIGIITSQDILELVDEELGEDYAKLAGLTEEEDLNEPLNKSMKKRMPWLIILLFMGMGVSAVVGMFEPVVAQIAMIVSFQSLILDMAGNVGTQSLAVTIRVLVDENLTGKQKAGLIWKEMRIGFFNGLLLCILSFVFVGFYISIAKHTSLQYGFSIAACVSVALLVAMVISSWVGTVVPMLFHKIKIDPAVASGPLITTVNDLVAVITYYGLTWILLLNILHINS